MNKQPTIITTSWDDGHVLDLRFAELLDKHGLTGTFYVPEHAEYGTMNASQIKRLGEHFEIGAHTIDHLALTELSDGEARRQIVHYKAWVEDVTGQACPMFCPPKGRFTKSHLAMVHDAGFTAVRTVEMFSLDYPRREHNLLVMPTTMQAHPHERSNYLRNVIKRSAWRNLWLYVRHGSAGSWTQIAQSIIDHLDVTGGVFHLWGHSWELERQGQWQRLDQVLDMLGSLANSATPATNGQVCDRSVQANAALSAA